MGAQHRAVFTPVERHRLVTPFAFGRPSIQAMQVQGKATLIQIHLFFQRHRRQRYAEGFAFGLTSLGSDATLFYASSPNAPRHRAGSKRATLLYRVRARPGPKTPMSSRCVGAPSLPTGCGLLRLSAGLCRCGAWDSSGPGPLASHTRALSWCKPRNARPHSAPSRPRRADTIRSRKSIEYAFIAHWILEYFHRNRYNRLASRFFHVDVLFWSRRRCDQP
jgi:hypothetical protein